MENPATAVAGVYRAGGNPPAPIDTDGNPSVVYRANGNPFAHIEPAGNPAGDYVVRASAIRIGHRSLAFNDYGD